LANNEVGVVNTKWTDSLSAVTLGQTEGRTRANW